MDTQNEFVQIKKSKRIVQLTKADVFFDLFETVVKIPIRNSFLPLRSLKTLKNTGERCFNQENRRKNSFGKV